MATGRARTRATGSSLGRIRVEGDSMWPVVRPGDVACFEPLEGMPSPGELLLGRVGDRLVLHRCVAAGERQVVLQGDNCAHPDKPVPPSQLLGRVVALERAGRRIEAEALRGLRGIGPSAMFLLRAARRLAEAA